MTLFFLFICTGKVSNPVLNFGAGASTGSSGLTLGGVGGTAPNLGFGTQQGEAVLTDNTYKQRRWEQVT